MENFNVEATFFNLLGGSLILCAALIVVVPILVWIGNHLCAALWHFVDEGETSFVHRFKSTYLVEEEPDVEAKRLTHKHFVVRVISGDYASHYYDKGSKAFVRDVPNGALFESKEEAKELAKSPEVLQACEKVPSLKKNFFIKVDRVVAVAIILTLGAGFLCLPTVTLFTGSAVLSLYSLRWARRGIKGVRKLKESLDAHKQDKEAHQ